MSVSFVGASLSRPDLEKMAKSLSIKETDSLEVFDRAYALCQKGEWERIDPIAKELSHLVDKIGRTLLMKAAMQQNSKVVSGLVERSIGITTTDKYGKTALHYLACGAAGIHSSEYGVLIKSKLESSYTKESLAPCFEEEKKLQKEQAQFEEHLEHLDPIAVMQTLQQKTMRHLKDFEYYHPGVLNELRFLAMIKSRMGHPDANQARELYERWFTALFGFAPVTLEPFSPDSLLTAARNGRVDEVNRFLTSCPTRFATSPSDTFPIIFLLGALGEIYLAQHKGDKADRIMDIALSYAPETMLASQPELHALLNLQAGQAAQLNHQMGKAENYYNKAIDVYESSSFPGRDEKLYGCYRDRSRFYYGVGKLELADRDIRKVVEYGESGRHPYPHFLNEALLFLTTILISKKDFKGALFYAEISLAMCNENNLESDPLGRKAYSCALANLSTIAKDTGDLDKALKYAEQNVQFLEKYHETNVEILTIQYMALVSIYRERKDYEKAHRYALKVYNNTAGASAETDKSWALASAIKNLGQISHHAKKYKEAIHYYEESYKLIAAQQNLLPHDDWQIAIFKQMWEVYLLWEHALLCDFAPDKALVVSEMRRARALANTLSKRIFPEKTAASELTLENIYDVAEQQKTTFVVYTIYDNNTRYCWVVLPNRQFKIVRMPAANDQLIEDCDKLIESQTRGEDPEEELSRGEIDREKIEKKKQEALARKQEKKRKFNENLKVLYKDYIEPIEELLRASPSKKVTFITDGHLAKLPFAIFRRGDGKYFIEEYVTLVAPSIRILSLLGELRKQRGAMSPSCESLIVGNPVNPPNSNLKNLPQAEREGKEVKELLGAKEEQLMLNQKATINSVVPLMKKARRIHFACHGSHVKNEGSHSEYSGLLHLTPDADHKEGKLYADDIAKMRLEADLVFLSACHSGKGNASNIYEGLVGLTRAFASSGALTTVSSYWELPDQPVTVELVKTFYKHILEDKPLGKGAALQKAMVEAIEKHREEPLKWGALFITGLD